MILIHATITPLFLMYKYHNYNLFILLMWGRYSLQVSSSHLYLSIISEFIIFHAVYPLFFKRSLPISSLLLTHVSIVVHSFSFPSPRRYITTFSLYAFRLGSLYPFIHTHLLAFKLYFYIMTLHIYKLS